ncbi:mechanosensitive ion channel family protein [Methanoculleus chikugoensis]|uniref:mechanosensitive ion channel family protein n=1 Tax=Methanoculleus chikugoensis TaxID=118126 RepID=UPI001FB4D8E5|nr:mechanosensitive ion channel family protein [Methanoculleus chikugoensis]
MRQSGLQKGSSRPTPPSRSRARRRRSSSITWGDDGVNLTAYIWAPARNWWDVRTDLLWKIKQALEENGIEMPFPQRTVWFADGPEAKGGSAEKNE